MLGRSLVKTVVLAIGGYFSKEVCRREFIGQRFEGVNERPVEYRFVFDQLTQLCPETVLDVGTGTTALPHLMRTCGCLVTAIDNVKDYWPAGMFNRHYHVLDDDIVSPNVRGPFDLITCISTLEHIRNHDQAVRMMLSLLRPGGRLLLTCPYNEHQYVENVYALPGSIGADRHPFVTQAFSRREVDRWIADNDAAILTQEYWRFFSGGFWTLGDEIVPPTRVHHEELHQISCIALQKRTSASRSLPDVVP